MNPGHLFPDQQRHKLVSLSPKYGGPHLAYEAETKICGTGGQEGHKRKTLLDFYALLLSTHLRIPPVSEKHWLHRGGFQTPAPTGKENFPLFTENNAMSNFG